MLQREAEIINKLGLHARASAKLTQLAGQFASNISVARNGKKVNAKSIMGVMMLAAAKGTTINIEPRINVQAPAPSGNAPANTAATPSKP